MKKKLQNTFTTPELSKRLLELGVPADSANMHYHQECVRIEYGKEEFEYFLRYGEPDTNKYSTDIPCWSVGRLMEIFDICSTENNTAWLPYYELDEDYITYIMHLYEQGELDFSKLEE